MIDPSRVDEVERLEQELDQFIERRARQAADQEHVEELWAKSEREHREKRRQANGWAWINYHEHLARFHRSLSLEHDEKAEHVRGLLGVRVHEAKEEEMNPNKNGHAADVHGASGHTARGAKKGETR